MLFSYKKVIRVFLFLCSLSRRMLWSNDPMSSRERNLVLVSKALCLMRHEEKDFPVHIGWRGEKRKGLRTCR